MQNEKIRAKVTEIEIMKILEKKLENREALEEYLIRYDLYSHVVINNILKDSKIEHDVRKVLNQYRNDLMIKVHLINKKINQIKLRIKGPIKTPYEGGIFEFKIKLNPQYPNESCFVRSETPIWHPFIHNLIVKGPNVKIREDLCVPVASQPYPYYKHPMTLDEVIKELISYLQLDFGNEKLEYTYGKAKDQYLSNKKQFLEKAREFTKTFAQI